MGNSASTYSTNRPSITIDKLICALCKNYLSCAPIRLLSDGRSICGRCPAPCDESVSRELSFEHALSNVLFPCRYKQQGCRNNLIFGSILNHEAQCLYIPIKCPIIEASCNWEGAISHISTHFSLQHGTLISDSDFILETAVSKAETRLFKSCGVPFMIKYRYDHTKAILYYNICYFTIETLNVAYILTLFNFESQQNCVRLNSLNCFPFPKSKEENLVLSNYMNVLQNSPKILFRIQCFVHQFVVSAVINSTQINYTVLESLRCSGCQHYLALPIFDSPKGTICKDCSREIPDSRCSNNLALSKLITDNYYPCRWRNCSRKCKGDKIREHELACQFYPYKCPFRYCGVTKIMRTMTFHLCFTHLTIPFFTTYSYKFSLKQTIVRHLAAYLKNDILLIKHDKTPNTLEAHTFSMQYSTSTYQHTSVTIYFTHSHCKLRSKTFTIDAQNSVDINLDKLPKCFTNQEKLKVVFNYDRITDLV